MRSGASTVRFWLSALFWVTDCQLLLASLHGGEQRGESSSLLTLIRTLNPFMRFPPSWSQQILITYLGPAPIIPSHWRHRVSTYEFQGHINIYSIAPSISNSWVLFLINSLLFLLQIELVPVPINSLTNYILVYSMNILVILWNQIFLIHYTI